LGLFSRKIRREAVVRRYQRLRSYTYIWRSIDRDEGGSIDAAELRGYVRHRSVDDAPPLKIYAKDFCEWGLKEMHKHFCFWLGNSESAKRRFERYDFDASGSVSWDEFVSMCEEAFQPLFQDDLSFSMASSPGNCSKHGQCAIFSVDMRCVKCEFAKHSPAEHMKQNREWIASLELQVLENVHSAAYKLKEGKKLEKRKNF